MENFFRASFSHQVKVGDGVETVWHLLEIPK